MVILREKVAFVCQIPVNGPIQIAISILSGTNHSIEIDQMVGDNSLPDYMLYNQDCSAGRSSINT